MRNLIELIPGHLVADPETILYVRFDPQESYIKCAIVSQRDFTPSVENIFHITRIDSHIDFLKTRLPKNFITLCEKTNNGGSTLITLFNLQYVTSFTMGGMVYGPNGTQQRLSIQTVYRDITIDNTVDSPAIYKQLMDYCAQEQLEKALELSNECDTENIHL